MNIINTYDQLKSKKIKKIPRSVKNTEEDENAEDYFITYNTYDSITGEATGTDTERVVMKDLVTRKEVLEAELANIDNLIKELKKVK